MTRLSVNINKVATLRNARGENVPDVVKFAVDCQRFGAQGITVHPRPDARHITHADVLALRPVVTTEFNIEGYPSEEFLALIEQVKPDQVTLVPDVPGVLTSSAGWDTKTYLPFLTEVCRRLRKNGMRSSIFVNPDPLMIEAAAKAGADRIELYTKPYADDPEDMLVAYVAAAETAGKLGLGINAGHDLSLQNLYRFSHAVPGLAEVSIGHALISDALYLGLQETIRAYLKCLQP